MKNNSVIEGAQKINYFTIDKLYYFFPLACSFLFFFKIGDISYWFDELVTVNTINPDTTKDFVSNYFRNELHPPLYFLLVKFYIKCVTLLTESAKVLWLSLYNTLYSSLVFNHVLQWFDNTYQLYFSIYLPHKINNLSELSVRLLSAVSMTAVNFVIFNFFKKYMHYLVGVLVCLMIGLNSQMINFAQNARPYALFTLIFVLVAIEFKDAYKKELTFNNLKKLIVLNTLLMLTHYYGIFVILSEVSILLYFSKHKKKFKYFAAIFFLSFFAFVFHLDIFFNLDRLHFLKTDTLGLVINIYKAVLGNFGYIVLAIGLVSVATKIILKKHSTIDKILAEMCVLFILIFTFINITNAIRPIFYERYTFFLVPLFIGILVSIIYSAVEFLGSCFKTKEFKLIVFYSLFTYSAYRFTAISYVNTFYYENYFENGKYYPIKQAYQKIAADSDFYQGAEYVLEEYIPQYFSYYENLYGTKPFLTIDPSLNSSKKNEILREKLNSFNKNVFYYIKVLKKEPNLINYTPLYVPGYKKQILMSRHQIQLFKFVRGN